MLHYPKIPASKACQLGPCVIFDKIDGTNLHWDWERDYGWHAFGTRRDSFNLLDAGIHDFEKYHPNLKGCAALFLETLAVKLEQAIPTEVQSLTAFAEYAGPNSFAGSHDSEDPKSLILFDVTQDGRMLGPYDFLQRYGHLPIPRVIYRGKFKGQVLEDVYEGRLGVAEGVVVKGDGWMAKIKTRAYQEKLKSRFGESWQDYWE